MMKPTDEELEAMAERLDRGERRMDRKPADNNAAEAALRREAAALLRACKGRDQADVARDVAEQIACAPWGTLWNHGTTPTLKERAEWKGRREAALEILEFLDPECAMSITAARDLCRWGVM